MRYFIVAALVASIAACAASPPPVLAPSPGPEDAAGPMADTPYRPVMAGTSYHGVGATP